MNRKKWKKFNTSAKNAIFWPGRNCTTERRVASAWTSILLGCVYFNGNIKQECTNTAHTNTKQQNEPGGWPLDCENQVIMFFARIMGWYNFNTGHFLASHFALCGQGHTWRRSRRALSILQKNPTPWRNRKCFTKGHYAPHIRTPLGCLVGYIVKFQAPAFGYLSTYSHAIFQGRPTITPCVLEAQKLTLPFPFEEGGCLICFFVPIKPSVWLEQTCHSTALQAPQKRRNHNTWCLSGSFSLKSKVALVFKKNW